MGHKFAEIAFTDRIKQLQEDAGSRASYARTEQGDDANFLLSPTEAAFIAARDSFYMASTGETGWPYVQHRGGPKGFLQVLDETTIGFADFRGNKQYVSTGNIGHDDRVSLILMDYPNKRRLKILGRAKVIDLADTETLDQLALPDYRARVERGIAIHIEAFDWNCPQHITPRYTLEEAEMLLG
jgi:predicted pyridoxine 5'-phosphate oxidase superfamily flavin-nucleotide-binding protein